jgi:glutathione S-transferase
MARVIILEQKLAAEVEIIEAQTRTPNSPYYGINPSGRVPYLVRDDGPALEDSTIICAYLDHYKNAPVVSRPADYGNWEHRRLEMRARSLMDGLTTWTREMNRPERDRSPTILEHEEGRAERMAQFWEEEIDHPLMNEAFNMAQLTLIAALDYGRVYAKWDWHRRHPKLAAWAERIAQRPAVAATMPR